MLLGKNGKWSWLSSKAACMSDVVEKCPQSVIDKFVLVTSLDSGLVILDEERIKNGWKYVGKKAQNPELTSNYKVEGEFALSPRVTNPADIPKDICHGNTYDEWYVFTSPPQIEAAEVLLTGADLASPSDILDFTHLKYTASKSAFGTSFRTVLRSSRPTISGR